MLKKRLDVYLSQKNIVRSRNVAKSLIEQSKVKVNNKIVNKPNYEINESDHIEIIENEKYVSRGAYKLLKAIDYFKLNLMNIIAIDIGASTGGFTQVLLEKGCKKIYCIDVGKNQLSDELKNDERVINLENMNFKDVEINFFNEKIDFITIDVSFISVKKILSKIIDLNLKNITIICLLKPQFELGKEIKKSNGFVSKNKHNKIIDDFIDWICKNNFIYDGYIESPILGAKKENKEFLFKLRMM